MGGGDWDSSRAVTVLPSVATTWNPADGIALFWGLYLEPWHFSVFVATRRTLRTLYLSLEGSKCVMKPGILGT